MSYDIKSLFRSAKEKKEQAGIQLLKQGKLPSHVAIIMDGNGRWAKGRNLPRAMGHRAGMEALKRTVQSTIKIGIPYLTVYAFSTENWKRPREEIDALMGLLVEYIDKELQQLHENGVRVRTLGILEDLPDKARKQIEKAMETTKDNTRLNLQIALNYGGRREITDAVRRIAKAVQAGELGAESIDEDTIKNNLYTAEIPDPDLIIRPSGEMRISNYLLWQSAYAEFWFSDVLWPDFNEDHLYQAVCSYQKRHRRYGGL